MDLFKRIAVFIVIGCYLVGSSVFAHFGSMDTYTAQQDTMKQMHMMGGCAGSEDLPTAKGDCIIECLETHDDNITIAVPTAYKEQSTRLFIGINLSDFSLSDDHTEYQQDPPDERSIAYSKQMPYFSHKDTTKLE